MHARKSDQDKLTVLRKRADFLHAQGHGQRFGCRGLVIHSCANEGLGLRVGYTVTKRTEKSAVARNRIKRRLRAIAADILPGNAVSDTDYILIGKSETAARSYTELCGDLRYCLKKMDRLRAN